MKTSEQEFEYKPTLSGLKLVTLSNDGVHLYKLKTNDAKTMESLEQEEGFSNYPGAEIAKFSPLDGKHLAVVDQAGIHIVDVSSKQEIMTMERRGIIALEWSPRGSFVMSCTKCKEGSNNLNLWHAQTGKLLYECEWKNSAKEGPQSIKFDSEERFCAR